MVMYSFLSLSLSYTQTVIGATGIPGLGVTPSKASSSRHQGPHSLLQMREKLTWTASDHCMYLSFTCVKSLANFLSIVNIYDARAHFCHAKPPSLQFSLDDIDGLPRIVDEELSCGDLIMALYSASEFKSSRGPAMGLSLNLYGIVLLAKAQR